MTPQEIDRREAEVRAGTAPVHSEERVGSNRLLLALRLLVGLEYGLAFFVGIAYPIGHQLFRENPDETPIFGVWIDETTFFFMVAAFSYAWMTHTLKSLGDAPVARIWTFIALAIAPFSAWFYMVATSYLLPDIYHPLMELSTLFVGFCMPFVLITLWLKYRYRQDEF